eukprot:3212262-Pleurochrysis_carterae.AAC.1
MHARGSCPSAHMSRAHACSSASLGPCSAGYAKRPTSTERRRDARKSYKAMLSFHASPAPCPADPVAWGERRVCSGCRAPLRPSESADAWIG